MSLQSDATATVRLVRSLMGARQAGTHIEQTVKDDAPTLGLLTHLPSAPVCIRETSPGPWEIYLPIYQPQNSTHRTIIHGSIPSMYQYQTLARIVGWTHLVLQVYISPCLNQQHRHCQHISCLFVRKCRMESRCSSLQLPWLVSTAISRDLLYTNSYTPYGTNLVGYVHISPMGDKNRRAFIMTLPDSHHQRCRSKLLITAQHSTAAEHSIA